MASSSFTGGSHRAKACLIAEPSLKVLTFADEKDYKGMRVTSRSSRAVPIATIPSEKSLEGFQEGRPDGSGRRQVEATLSSFS